jgi:2,3-dihydroxybenzoate decarboxylase
MCFDHTGLSAYSVKDYPYDSIKEAQDWWKSVELTHDEKEKVARRNAIRTFNLPLEV